MFFFIIITEYILEYRRHNEEWNPVHVPRDKSSFQLTRLDNSMTYEVRLAAYNEHGRGEFSSSLSFTTTERGNTILLNVLPKCSHVSTKRHFLRYEKYVQFI